MVQAPPRKRPKRVVPFLEAHEYLYGVRVVERDPFSNEVASVLCMFCAAFGREDDPQAAARQRARTQKPKYWGGPCFRSDNYKSHLTMQHPARWKQYQMMPAEQKRSYFDAVPVPPKQQQPRRSLDHAAVATITEQTMEQATTPADERMESKDEDQSFDAASTESSGDSGAASVEDTGASVAVVQSPATVAVTAAVRSPAAEVFRPEVAAVAPPVALAEVSEPVELEDEHAALTFLLDRDVVNVALGDVLFEAGEVVNGDAGKVSALFENTLDQCDEQDQEISDGTAEYRAVVLSVEVFRRVVELLALGLSFDQTAAICQTEAVGRIQGSPCASTDVVSIARIAVGANLQALSRILQRVWAFSLHLHSVDRRRPGESESRMHLDVRLRACCSGNIEVFHLLSLPITTRGDPSTIGEILFDKTARFLEGLHKRWLHKVIGCSTEAVGPDNTDNSSVASVVASTLARRVKQHGIAELVRVSSARPPLDMMIQRFIDSILFADGAEWHRHFSRLLAYLQRQTSIENAEELTTAAVGPCPRFSNMPWWRLVDVVRWFDNARVPIQRLLARRNLSIAPPPTWWLYLKMMLVIGSIAIKTRADLQEGYANLLSQQPQRISMLCIALAGDVGVDGPLPEYQRAALRDQSVSGTVISSNDGMFTVKPHSIVAFVRGMDSWVAELFDTLSAEEHQKIIVTTADRVLELVHGLHGLTEELEEHRGSSTTSLRSFPPVLPHQVAMLHPVDFQEIIRLHRARLTVSLSDAELAAIETQHHELRTAATSEAAVRQLLNLRAEGPAASFYQAWEVFRSRWRLLAEFCGGLATVFPSSKSDRGRSAAATSSLASTATGLRADLSLEARLQCQQFARLQAVDDTIHSIGSVGTCSGATVEW